MINRDRLKPGENCCNCVRDTYIQCGYCQGYGTIEEGVDGASAGPCHCCGPFNFNAIIHGRGEG
jgi:hypothetical protein